MLSLIHGALAFFDSERDCVRSIKCVLGKGKGIIKRKLIICTPGPQSELSSFLSSPLEEKAGWYCGFEIRSSRVLVSRIMNLV